MATSEKDCSIQYFIDNVNTDVLDKRSTELSVKEFQSTFATASASLESLKMEMKEIKAELRDERSKRKKAEAKARKIDQQLKYAQFKGTEHQICMAHAVAKLAKAEMERTIRKFTTQRNNSLHYGNDEGVEIAVAYYSVISTVKLHGMS